MHSTNGAVSVRGCNPRKPKDASDAQGRVVYGWTITPPKRTIEARGKIEFDSAEIDVPKGSKKLNLSFSGAPPK